MRRLLFTLTLTTLLLTACATDIIYLPVNTATVEVTHPTPTTSPPTSTPEPTKAPDLGVSTEALRGLTISLWHGLDGSQAQLLAQMAAEFSLSNAWGITVNVNSQGNLSGLAQAIRNGKNGQGLPELALALPEQAQAWDEDALLAEINPYLENPEFGFSKQEINDFPAGLWRQDAIENRRLGLPATRSTRLLFYNQSWARQLGFENPPQTAAEFREQVCAANASWKTDVDETNDGYGGLVLDNDPWTAYSWLKAFGGDVSANAAFDFVRPENEAALTFLQELRTAGCAWLTPGLTPFAHFAARRALVVSGNLSEITAQNAALRAAGSADQWTVLPFPGSQERAVVTYGPSFLVLKTSPARQLAGWLFVRWALSPENQARWARESGFLPVRASALGLLASFRSVNPQWAAAADLMPQMSNYSQLAGWPLARQMLGDGFYTALMLNLPAETVLIEMQKTIEEVLEQ
jgi:ABC-type glycerol-3-phosphate transport system substrate-binding protein